MLKDSNSYVPRMMKNPGYGAVVTIGGLSNYTPGRDLQFFE